MRSLVALMIAVGMAIGAWAADEDPLFDAQGKAKAYIAEDLTIYLWAGKPVAYLDRDSAGDGFNIYGSNGKHIGWFVKGVARDHNGNAACAVKSTLRLTELEPLKGLKELKPLKSLKELAPLRPLFTREWSETPCRIFLAEGES